MGLTVVVFLLTALAIIGTAAGVTHLPGLLARRRLDERLHEVTAAPAAAGDNDATVLKRVRQGPLPAVDRFVARARVTSRLARLIEQSGVRTTASAMLLWSLVCPLASALLVLMITRRPIVVATAAVAGIVTPWLWLRHRRTSRLARFEEQFPEALDLLSRAIRAGHAFQAALGTAGDELGAPVGPEMKKTFERQNFGLPLKDALHELAERVPLLDVRFFVTAVSIQRETGGNLAEILDNLAHVVRERFKIRRQVRVHTAQGRFTAFVLLALPAFLAIALSSLNPDHMQLLFRERLGQTLLAGAVILQTIGFFWIRRVIRIEV